MSRAAEYRPVFEKEQKWGQCSNCREPFPTEKWHAEFSDDVKRHYPTTIHPDGRCTVCVKANLGDVATAPVNAKLLINY